MGDEDMGYLFVSHRGCCEPSCCGINLVCVIMYERATLNELPTGWEGVRCVGFKGGE